MFSSTCTGCCRSSSSTNSRVLWRCLRRSPTFCTLPSFPSSRCVLIRISLPWTRLSLNSSSQGLSCQPRGQPARCPEGQGRGQEDSGARAHARSAGAGARTGERGEWGGARHGRGDRYVWLSQDRKLFHSSLIVNYSPKSFGFTHFKPILQRRTTTPSRKWATRPGRSRHAGTD